MPWKRIVGGRIARLGREEARRSGPSDADAKVLLAISGGGPAWRTIGRELYETVPRFRASVEAAEALVRGTIGFSPAASYETGWKPGTWAHARQADIVNMGLMSLGVCDELAARGVRPAGALGLSLGEAVAAHVAGVLTRDEALTVICALARRVGHEPRECLHLGLRVDTATATALCRLAPAPLGLVGEAARGVAMLLCAAEDADAIRAYLAPFEIVDERQVKGWYHVRGVPFDRAGFAADVAGVAPRPQTMPLYSCALGGRIADRACDADHWRRSGSAPHFFGETIANAFADGYDVAIEVGSPLICDWMRATANHTGYATRVIAWNDWEPALARAAPRTPVARIAEAETRDEAVRFLPNEQILLVTGNAAVRSVLLQPLLYSNAPYRDLDRVLLGSDPPEHAPARALLARQLGLAVLSRIEARAIAAARERASPEFDAVGEFAAPVSQAAAAEFIGLDGGTLREIALGDCAITAAARGFAAKVALVDGLAPRATLYDALRQTVGDAEARSLVRLMWFASVATTERAIARTIQCLIERPDLQDAIANEPALLARTVDEVVRLHLPAPMLQRVTTAPCTVEGVALPAGAMVHLDLAAANRDPAVFDAPGELRPGRPGKHGLTFGTGVHACIGAALSRRVVPAAVGTLIEGRRLRSAQALDSRFLVVDAATGPVRLQIEVVTR